MPGWCPSYTYSSIYKYDDDMLILGLTMTVHSWSWKPRTFCDEVLAQHLKRWQCFLEVSWQSSIWSLDSPRLKYWQWLTKYEVCTSFMMTIQVCVNAWLWWTWQVWFSYLDSDIPDYDWLSIDSHAADEEAIWRLTDNSEVCSLSHLHEVSLNK